MLRLGGTSRRSMSSTAVASPGLHARMAQHGFGRIVFITSDTLWDPPAPVLLPYVASKGALIESCAPWRRALGPVGVAVTAVAPA